MQPTWKQYGILGSLGVVLLVLMQLLLLPDPRPLGSLAMPPLLFLGLLALLWHEIRR